MTSSLDTESALTVYKFFFRSLVLCYFWKRPNYVFGFMKNAPGRNFLNCQFILVSDLDLEKIL